MDSESFEKEILCNNVSTKNNGAILDNEVFSISSDENDVSIIEENCMYSRKEVFSLSSSDENEEVEFLSEKSLPNNKIQKKKINKFLMVSSDSEFSDNFADDININIQSDASDGNVSDVITEVTVQWNKVSSPTGWTKKMRRYYNKPCKRQRYFDWKRMLIEIRAGPPSKWQILKEDIYPVSVRRKRCLICRQTDHLSRKCPRKEGICIMCGVPGHLFFNCPQTMCLNCGVRTNDFMDRCGKCYYEESRKCKSCRRYGHGRKNCPDLWRRFHCTVEDKEINSSETELNKNIQCCNCAKQGHMYEQCTEKYWSTYNPTSFVVTSYNDNGLEGKFNRKREFNLNNATSSRSDNRSSLKRSRQCNGSSDDEQSSKQTKFFQQNDRWKKPRSFFNDFNISNSLGCFNEMFKKRRYKRKKKTKNKKNSNIEQN